MEYNCIHMETMNGLLEFVYVVENSSFSKAAEKLNVSKSHISKQVSRLEESLQTKLLIRTTRKLALTEIGEELYNRSKSIFDELNEIQAYIGQYQIEPRGTLRLSVAGKFAEDYLSLALSEFSKIYPKLSIDIVFSGEVVDLVESGFDIAIRYGKLKSSTLISKKIAKRKDIICASNEYLEKNGVPKKIEDLKNHNCLAGTNPIWTFRDKGKLIRMKVRGSWNVNNGHSLVVAAEQGIGLVRLPISYVRTQLEKGQLVEVLSKFALDDQSIWLVYPDKKFLPIRTRLLINFLSEYFDSHYKNFSF